MLLVKITDNVNSPLLLGKYTNYTDAAVLQRDLSFTKNNYVCTPCNRQSHPWTSNPRKPPTALKENGLRDVHCSQLYYQKAGGRTQKQTQIPRHVKYDKGGSTEQEEENSLFNKWCWDKCLSVGEKKWNWAPSSRSQQTFTYRAGNIIHCRLCRPLGLWHYSTLLLWLKSSQTVRKPMGLAVFQWNYTDNHREQAWAVVHQALKKGTRLRKGNKGRK